VCVCVAYSLIAYVCVPCCAQLNVTVNARYVFDDEFKKFVVLDEVQGVCRGCVPVFGAHYVLCCIVLYVCVCVCVCAFVCVLTTRRDGVNDAHRSQIPLLGSIQWKATTLRFI